MDKTPEPTELDNVHHVAIEVKNIQESVNWYTERFNCKVSYQDATWAMIEFGNLKMALVLPEEHASHVGIERPDAESFGPLNTHRDGVRYVYITDPAGNTVEVVAKEP
jgi:catechol 2,3-dioxygenase-like lactoylglutathione lyase family enzyme